MDAVKVLAAKKAAEDYRRNALYGRETAPGRIVRLLEEFVKEWEGENVD